MLTLLNHTDNHFWINDVDYDDDVVKKKLQQMESVVQI